MSWQSFDEGRTLGQYGSEGGRIIRDEEHEGGARITLERGGQTVPFTITCGIYGWMVHTRFFGAEPEAQGEFDLMKPALATILGTIPLASDPDDAKLRLVCNSISEFVERFPT